jgi:hypothetical protein
VTLAMIELTDFQLALVMLAVFGGTMAWTVWTNRKDLKRKRKNSGR